MRRGSRTLSAAETGISSRLLVPGAVALLDQEVRLERCLDEVRAVLVRLVEQWRDAGLDLVAAALQREDVCRREPEAPGSIRHRRRGKAEAIASVNDAS